MIDTHLSLMIVMGAIQTILIVILTYHVKQLVKVSWKKNKKKGKKRR